MVLPATRGNQTVLLRVVVNHRPLRACGKDCIPNEKHRHCLFSILSSSLNTGVMFSTVTRLEATRARPKTHRDADCQITEAQAAAAHLSSFRK